MSTDDHDDDHDSPYNAPASTSEYRSTGFQSAEAFLAVGRPALAQLDAGVPWPQVIKPSGWRAIAQMTIDLRRWNPPRPHARYTPSQVVALALLEHSRAWMRSRGVQVASDSTDL
jgi:hypothetical protein